MSLLDRYREGSELDSVGFFTLDESKARRKMSRYQLVQVEEFLLLVVQAVVAAGVQELAISVEKNQIRLEARGTSLEADKLGQLGDFLFDTRPEAVPYYLIGVAENAVEPHSLEPPRIGLEDEWFVFEVRTREVLGNLPSLLRKRLRYLDPPATLNQVELETEPLKGETRLELTKGLSSQITLVRNGVVVTTRIQSFPSLNILAIAPANHLTLDASFSDVVEDETLNKLVQGLLAQASLKLTRMVETYQPGDDRGRWFLDLLEQVQLEPARSALQKCPLFTLADRDGRLCWNELATSVEKHGTILTSKTRLNLQLDTPVVLAEPGVLSTLEKLLGAGQVESSEPAYRRKLEALENKARWENSPRPTELPPGNYLAQRKIERSKWQAEAGILGFPGGQSSVDILFQGKLLITESLEGFPPGSAVVLNFDQVKVDEMWTRATGRVYRTALKDLKVQTTTLFEGLQFDDPRAIYPALRDHLESLLSEKNPPPVARSAPLFATTEGRILSLDQVAQLPEILLGDRVEYPDTLPPELLPQTVLIHSPTPARILRKQFSERTVVDFRSAQAHRLKIAEQLKTPRQPVLEPECWLTAKLDDPGVQGEVGLTRDQGKGLQVTMLHQGVVVEEFKTGANRVLSAHAIVQAEAMTPSGGWSCFIKDQEYKHVLAQIQRKAQALEVEALDQPQLDTALKLSLLHAYPQQLGAHENTPLFPSSKPGTHLSLVEIRQELQKHGTLLRGELGLILEDRPVVRSPVPYQVSDLLQRGLGLFDWAEAADILEKRVQERSFLAREIHEEIVVDGVGFLTLPVKSGRGQIVLGCLQVKLLEGVVCYVGGRRICCKTNILPAGCRAAWEHEDFRLSEDFQDLEIPPHLIEELRLTCAEGMLELLQRERHHQRLFALKYFAQNSPPPDIQGRLDKLELFECQGGGRVSLALLRKQGRTLHYVDPGFPPEITTSDLVLRIPQSEVAVLPRLVSKRLLDASRLVRQEHQTRVYLESLPTELEPECFQMIFQGKYIEGVIGVPRGRAWIVGQTKEGQTLGYLRTDSLPVVAVVRGAVPRPPSECLDTQPEATLGVRAGRELQEAADEINLRWTRQLAHEAFDEKTRKKALKLLSLTKRELGSDTSHPQAEIAHLLWEVPLFERVDETFISGSDLAERYLSEPPLLLAQHREKKTPDEVLLTQPGSTSWDILVAVFGRDSLSWWEAPPLIDPARLKANVERLTAWGLTPLSAARAKLKKAAGALESRLNAAQPEPEVEVAPPVEKKEESAENQFLAQMKSDVVTYLGRSYLHGSDKLFLNTEMGSWVFGPPVYQAGITFRFNRSHASIRWLLSSDAEPKQKKLARLLLLIHWAGLVNVSSEQLTDDQERDFLLHLTEKLTQTYGAGSSKSSH